MMTDLEARTLLLVSETRKGQETSVDHEGWVLTLRHLRGKEHQDYDVRAWQPATRTKIIGKVFLKHGRATGGVYHHQGRKYEFPGDAVTDTLTSMLTSMISHQGG